MSERSADRCPPFPTKGRAAPILGAVAVAGTLLLPGCGGEGNPSGPPSVASVVVISPVGAVMAVDRSAELDAVARDASGASLSGRSFTWSSSAESVASVDGAGVVRGLEAGNARISAATGGVSGSLTMLVVAAELEKISGLLEDPFTEKLVSSLGDAPHENIGGALQACSDALADGHVLAVDSCLEEIASEPATEPTDRALIALLAVLAHRGQLFLNLETT